MNVFAFISWIEWGYHFPFHFPSIWHLIPQIHFVEPIRQRPYRLQINDLVTLK